MCILGFQINKKLLNCHPFSMICLQYLKSLPKFNGEDDVSTKKHIASFQDYIDYLEIRHDDVFMTMFSHSLEGNHRRWFKGYSVDSICSWVYFHDVFLDKWAEKKTHHQYISKFYSMKRNIDETLTKLNRRFQFFFLSWYVNRYLAL